MNALPSLSLPSADAVVWSHATNDPDMLAAALRPLAEGGVHMIEADILVGTVVADAEAAAGNGAAAAAGAERVAIMAHPPNTSSALPFSAFAATVLAHNRTPGARCGEPASTWQMSTVK